MPKHDALPQNLPPIGLCREASAQFIGISAGMFDKLVNDGRMPRPIAIDGRRVWDRRALVRAFDALGGDVGADVHNEWDDVA
jgi:hypothetical protein